MPSANEPPRIYPTFRYRDAVGMIDWLMEAFGFALHARHMNGKRWCTRARFRIVDDHAR